MWVALASSKDEWRKQIQGVLWSPEFGFQATDGRRAHVWMPSEDQKAIIAEKIDLKIEQLIDVWDNGFANIVKQETKFANIQSVIPKIDECEKVMNWSIMKRKIDIDIPQLIAKTGRPMNLAYLQDLATGECWDVYTKKDDPGHQKVVMFKSSGMTAVIMPMMVD